ncbi:hypothetical protein A3Q56_03761 [Intoshia linei]|uniref:Uncharacterized protein n=1 Tax=Intoshia linei TaxID=1819745 RepID=A0A177B2J9_9BILA|nr:hypothetical protein A3Q56_03761 [Intoshia linei]
MLSKSKSSKRYSKEVKESIFDISRSGNIELLMKAKRRWLNHADLDGITPLMITAMDNDLSHALKYLLNRRCSINEVDLKGCSALHHACKMKCHENVRILLDAGANMWMLNDEGSTPYLLALRCRSLKCQAILLNFEKDYIQNHPRKVDKMMKDAKKIMIRRKSLDTTFIHNTALTRSRGKSIILSMTKFNIASHFKNSPLARSKLSNVYVSNPNLSYIKDENVKNKQKSNNCTMSRKESKEILKNKFRSVSIRPSERNCKPLQVLSLYDMQKLSNEYNREIIKHKSSPSSSTCVTPTPIKEMVKKSVTYDPAFQNIFNF